MYELMFTVLAVLGLLVVAFGIAVLSIPIGAAGGFLVVASEFAAWLHSKKTGGSR
jgi:hypothetical protein